MNPAMDAGVGVAAGARARSAGFFLPWLACLACSAMACSSHDPKRPAELGDCVSTASVGCRDPSAGGGAAVAQTQDSGPQKATSQAADASGPTGCGAADSLVVTGNGYCRPCIVAQCCGADFSCSGDCIKLLACTTLQCASSDAGCVANCYQTWAKAVVSYGDFASCVATSCSPQCPTLQTQ